MLGRDLRAQDGAGPIFAVVQGELNGRLSVLPVLLQSRSVSWGEGSGGGSEVRTMMSSRLSGGKPASASAPRDRVVRSQEGWGTHAGERGACMIGTQAGSVLSTVEGLGWNDGGSGVRMVVEKARSNILIYSVHKEAVEGLTGCLAIEDSASRAGRKDCRSILSPDKTDFPSMLQDESATLLANPDPSNAAPRVPVKLRHAMRRTRLRWPATSVCGPRHEMWTAHYVSAERAVPLSTTNSDPVCMTTGPRKPRDSSCSER